MSEQIASRRSRAGGFVLNRAGTRENATLCLSLEIDGRRLFRGVPEHSRDGQALLRACTE